MRAIFVIRTRKNVLPTYDQIDAFVSRNEFSLAYFMSFPFYPHFSFTSHSFFPTQHMSNRPVTVQHSTVQFLVTQCNVPFILMISLLCPLLHVYTPLGLQQAAVKEYCHGVTYRDALCIASTDRTRNCAIGRTKRNSVLTVTCGGWATLCTDREQAVGADWQEKKSPLHINVRRGCWQAAHGT
jgi:hypothetical protein